MLNRKRTDLIARARERDPDAFTELMQMYMKDMYRVAVAILMQDDDAADAVQDTILTCWEKLSVLREDRFFKTWMTRILIHKCYDIRKTREKITDLKDYEEPFAEDTCNLEFKEALAGLDGKYRICIVLYYSEGYRIREIADMLQLPVSTVKTRLARGKEKLAVYYGGRKEWIV